VQVDAVADQGFGDAEEQPGPVGGGDRHDEVLAALVGADADRRGDREVLDLARQAAAGGAVGGGVGFRRSPRSCSSRLMRSR
jgi:hypothetical protein